MERKLSTLYSKQQLVLQDDETYEFYGLKIAHATIPLGYESWKEISLYETDGAKFVCYTADRTLMCSIPSNPSVITANTIEDIKDHLSDIDIANALYESCKGLGSVLESA